MHLTLKTKIPTELSDNDEKVVHYALEVVAKAQNLIVEKLDKNLVQVKTEPDDEKKGTKTIHVTCEVL